MTLRWVILCALLSSVAIGLLLSPALRLYFHADDFDWLQAARAAQRSASWELPEDVNGHFRPLTEAFWLMGYGWFGLSARGYHALTLVVHLLTASCVGLIAGRLAGSRAALLFGALVFGVNLSHRTVPTWISAAPDLLLGLGTALALLGFSLSGARRWLGLPGLAIALLAKESALMLVLALPLAAPRMRETPYLRAACAALGIALAVPHLIASLLSSYLRARFSSGDHVLGNLLEGVASLLVPVSGAYQGTAGELLRPGALGPQLLGLLGLLAVTGVAARRLGARQALGSLLAIALLLVLPATTRGELEPRWLYQPWVLLAPLLAAAMAETAVLVGRRLGSRRGGAGVWGIAIAGHLLVHGVLLREKLARDLQRDDRVRNIVEAAARHPPELETGATVEIVVPFGSELRSWPLGVQLALDRDVVVRIIDDRTPASAALVLDATRKPAIWR